MELPSSISAPPATLRVIIPKIWTQKESRAFGIYWSPEINHGTLYPFPTDDELAGFYRQEHYDRYLSGDAGARQFEPVQMTLPYRAIVKIAYLADRGAPISPLSTIAKLAPNSPTVCDLGCGGGAFLDTIRPVASKVVGVDPSGISAAAVKSLGIDFYEGTAEDLPAGLERGGFDVVTMLHSLEHVRDIARSLANAKSLLKPGGLIVIEVPNMDCIGFQIYPEVWIHTDAGRHLQFFTQRSLETFCRAAGLEPIALEFTGFTHQFLPERVKKMQIHWDILFEDGTIKPIALRASFFTSLKHLLRALFSADREKYDIIRIYARNTSARINDSVARNRAGVNPGQVAS